MNADIVFLPFGLSPERRTTLSEIDFDPQFFALPFQARAIGRTQLSAYNARRNSLGVAPTSLRKLAANDDGV